MTELDKMRDERCEGCGRPAVTHDVEGVPLCRKCADELEREALEAEKEA